MAEQTKQLIYTDNELKELYVTASQAPQTGFYSGLQAFDNIARFDRKQLVIFTATAGSGKSTFLNYYCYMMNKTHSFRSLFISFETTPEKQIFELNILYQDIDKAVSNNVIACSESIDSIDDIETIVSNSQTDIVVIDPFNFLPIKAELNTYTIGDVLRQFKRIAKQYDKMLILVAHPSKSVSVLTDDDCPTGLDIMGSVNFNNMADCIIGMRKKENNQTLFKVSKLRNNFDMGMQGGMVTLDFDFPSRSYSDGMSISTPRTQSKDNDTLPFEEATHEMIKAKINKAKENEKRK